MPLNTQPPDSDLILPLPGEGEKWDPFVVHTHYFGFTIPEHGIGGYLYIRYQPSFPMCGGGVHIYKGPDNLLTTHCEHLDYELTMPWPTIEGNKITTRNGLSFDFVELGKIARIQYEAVDGTAALDILATGVSPLVARGHILPDEEKFQDLTLRPGGSEQFMHMLGTLRLGNDTYTIDCYQLRDRSWNQIRSESREATNSYPPLTFTPVRFGPELVINVMGFQDPATDPLWKKGGFEYDAGERHHNWGWIWSDGELLAVERVRRNATRIHPVYKVPLDQEVQVTDERGTIHRMRGTGVAFTPIQAWANASAVETLTRWEHENGTIFHGPVQTQWGPKASIAMRRGAGDDPATTMPKA